MPEQQKSEYLKHYETRLISPAEEAMWKHGAPKAGYPNLGCCKSFVLMGEAFARADLELLEGSEVR